ncbi:hypothetical protein C1I98_20370 [Spongiactinospora gelatinilytica]|uniref:Uncharacterized protein n=1 Tax=Spongiactinospora gelatinilytica TaxID=2666298 RepID=A0A2W2G1Q0_9ACTN|nr:hypothetical protein [Spongiactinospora gelatinilytica]PZG42021.1 hypothetical protein C1I98_20370 [Spongiactinospora gelatinilytica]
MAKSGSGKSGKGGSGKGSTPMTGKAASRVQSSGDRNPSGKTASSGFGPRAQSAAAKNGG